MGVFIYRGDFKPNTSVSSKYFPRVKDITLFRVDFDIRENTRLLREKTQFALGTLQGCVFTIVSCCLVHSEPGLAPSRRFFDGGLLRLIGNGTSTLIETVEPLPVDGSFLFSSVSLAFFVFFFHPMANTRFSICVVF